MNSPTGDRYRGHTGDGQMTGRLTADLDDTTGHNADNSNTGTDDTNGTDRDDTHRNDGTDGTDDTDDIDTDGDTDDEVVRPAVYGDAAYGSGDQLAELDKRGIDAKVKCQPPSSRNGKFSKDDFTVDLDADTVSCPAGATVPIVRASDGSGVAHFGGHCASCPLRSRCTDAAGGRNVTIHRHEALLARQRERGRDADWLADYRATRPKVERKLAHLIRRGRRARRRGLERVDADWTLLAGAVNLARLATLRLHHTPGGWKIAPA